MVPRARSQPDTKGSASPSGRRGNGLLHGGRGAGELASSVRSRWPALPPRPGRELSRPLSLWAHTQGPGRTRGPRHSEDAALSLKRNSADPRCNFLHSTLHEDDTSHGTGGLRVSPSHPSHS